MSSDSCLLTSDFQPRTSAGWLCALLLSLLCAPLIRAEGPIPPIASGYGASGAFSVAVEKLVNPLSESTPVWIYHPAEINTPVPAIFFTHGFTRNEPELFSALITHIVSRGYAVVFSSYPSITLGSLISDNRYDIILRGYEEAARRFPQYLDTTRAGFMGHSYGGGATPWLTYKGITEKGWGKSAAFMFMVAPYYYFRGGPREFAAFPAHVKMLTQVYEGDNLCDHRIGKELHDLINLPASEKDILMVRAEKRFGYELKAEHSELYGGDGEEPVNGVDYYAVWRLFDALADYTFTGAADAKRIALGNGGAEQRYMGLWPDGQPVREMLGGDCLNLTRPQLSFTFPYFPNPDDVTVVSSASFRNNNGLAPGSLASALGSRLSATAASAPAPMLSLNGTTVRIKDSGCVEHNAPLFFASPAQVNFLVPETVALGQATVTAFNEAGAVAIGTIQVSATAPALFTASSTGSGLAAASLLRVKADGRVLYEAIARYDTAQNRFAAVPVDFGPDRGADSDLLFLVLYGAGLRGRTALSSVSARIGRVNAEVLYAGAQGDFLGLDQINLRLPRALAGAGEVDIVITVEGKTANTVRAGFR
ncbi:MAG: hypothetical protein ACKV2V_08500 [Blastocatellia bacterium]